MHSLAGNAVHFSVLSNKTAEPAGHSALRVKSGLVSLLVGEKPQIRTGLGKEGCDAWEGRKAEAEMSRRPVKTVTHPLPSRPL